MLNAALQNVNKLKEIATQYHWMKNRICTKFALCKPVENINFVKICTHCISGGCQVCTFCANLATTAYAMGANLNKVDICNRFAQGKLCANSIHVAYVPWVYFSVQFWQLSPGSLQVTVYARVLRSTQPRRNCN